MQLKDGDRILVGTSIIKLVHGSGEARAPAASLSEIEARSKIAGHGQPAGGAQSMSGNIEEIPLPDLLQFALHQPQIGRAGAALRSWGTGRLHLRKGQIYFANIDESFDVSPRKAMFRMLTRNQGLFVVGAARRPPGDGGTAGFHRGLAHGGHAPARRISKELSPKLPPAFGHSVSAQGRSGACLARSCARPSRRHPDWAGRCHRTGHLG